MSSQRQNGEIQGLLLQSRLEALGAIILINSAAERYSRYTVDEIMFLIAPALTCDQYRVYLEATKPVGFVTWAFLRPDIRSEVEKGRDVRPDEWTSGEELWFVDFVAPFGHASRIIRDLRSNIFAHHGVAAGAMRRRPDLTIRKTSRWLPRCWANGPKNTPAGL